MTIRSIRRSSRPAPNDMTLTEHLHELRHRLILCVLAFVACAIVAYVFYPQILGFFKHPYCESLPRGRSCDLHVFGPLDAFGIRLDITGYGGLVLASPIILFQAWRFVTPGLR